MHGTGWREMKRYFALSNAISARRRIRISLEYGGVLSTNSFGELHSWSAREASTTMTNAFAHNDISFFARGNIIAFSSPVAEIRPPDSPIASGSAPSRWLNVWKGKR